MRQIHKHRDVPLEIIDVLIQVMGTDGEDARGEGVSVGRGTGGSWFGVSFCLSGGGLEVGGEGV